MLEGEDSLGESSTLFPNNQSYLIRGGNNLPQLLSFKRWGDPRIWLSRAPEGSYGAQRHEEKVAFCGVGTSGIYHQRGQHVSKSVILRGVANTWGQIWGISAGSYEAQQTYINHWKVRCRQMTFIHAAFHWLTRQTLDTSMTDTREQAPGIKFQWLNHCPSSGECDTQQRNSN